MKMSSCLYFSGMVSEIEANEALKLAEEIVQSIVDLIGEEDGSQ
jgi:hypothetical protein